MGSIQAPNNSHRYCTSIFGAHSDDIQVVLYNEFWNIVESEDVPTMQIDWVSTIRDAHTVGVSSADKIDKYCTTQKVKSEVRMKLRNISTGMQVLTSRDVSLANM